MYTLVLDTHEFTNIAVFKDENILAYRNDNNPRQSTVIMPLIENIFKELNITVDDLNKVIVVNGPGSFTGIRLGVTIAKTMSFCKNIDTYVINSLEYIAILDDFKNLYYGVKDNKGCYIGTVNNGLINVEYKSNSEIEIEDIVTSVSFENISNIFKYKHIWKKKESHLINPIYIKKIEAQK